MKRVAMYIVTVFAVALAVGALAGCGQNASSGQSSASNAQPAASKQSKDEVISDLKSTEQNAPEFKSVTVNERTAWNYTNDSTGKPETTQFSGVYKFDLSSDQPKESITAEYGGQKLQFFTDGKTAVFVSDGNAYSGTPRQFGAEDYSGFDTFVKHVVGDLETVVGCAASAEKAESSGPACYMLTLDPEKYMASDGALTMLKEEGYPVKAATLTIALNESGNIGLMSLIVDFEGSSIEETLEFSDFNSTEVEPTPKATKTYEEMDEGMRSQIQEMMKELDAYNSSASTASSANATTAK